MIELGMETNIAMCTVLVGMAVYFVKSADLPQELKDRAKANAHLGMTTFRRNFEFSNKVQTNKVAEANKINLNINKNNERSAIDQEALILATKMLEEKMNNARMMEASKIEAQMIQKKMTQVSRKIDFEKLNKRIDQITYAITTLEMELKRNSSKNNEIQTQIDRYLLELERLNSKRLA